MDYLLPLKKKIKKIPQIQNSKDKESFLCLSELKTLSSCYFNVSLNDKFLKNWYSFTGKDAYQEAWDHTHVKEGENWLWQVVLWLSNVYHDKCTLILKIKKNIFVIDLKRKKSVWFFHLHICLPKWLICKKERKKRKEILSYGR